MTNNRVGRPIGFSIILIPAFLFAAFKPPGDPAEHSGHRKLLAGLLVLIAIDFWFMFS